MHVLNGPDVTALIISKRPRLVCHVFRVLKLKSFQHWRPPHGDQQIWAVWRCHERTLETNLRTSWYLPTSQDMSLQRYRCFCATILPDNVVSQEERLRCQGHQGHRGSESSQPKILHTIPKSAGRTSRLIWHLMMLRHSAKSAKAGRARWHM